MALSNLRDHFNSIEGPSNLVPVPGKFISGECKKFRGVKTSTLVADPEVLYTYRVSGKSYEGSRYARSNRYAMGNPQECERYLSSMKARPEITVWVDPDHPEFSVLSNYTPEPLFEYAFMSMGLAFVAIGCYFIYSRRHDEV